PYAVDCLIDVHLMVEPVDALVPLFARAGAGQISFHPEASRHVDRTLELIHDHGCRAGLAINPGTPLGLLEPVIDKLELVWRMPANPGSGGQASVPATPGKRRAARALLDEQMREPGRTIRPAAAGGAKADNIASIAAAGTVTFVAGSAIFGASDYRTVIEEM